MGVSQGTKIPLSIEINSWLGKWIHLLEYESVPFAYFHYKKYVHIAKKFLLQVEKEKPKKERKLQWKAKNNNKKVEEEIQNVIIPDTFEQKENYNDVSTEESKKEDKEGDQSISDEGPKPSPNCDE